GPAVPAELAGVTDARDEEDLVLAHVLALEVEDRAACEHRPDQVGDVDAQPGLLGQLTDRGVLGSLVAVDAAPDREPPRPLRPVDVVTAHQQDAVVLVDQQHPRRGAAVLPVGAPAPLRPESRAHQPRSASRCGTGMSSTLMPTIASPRPRDTLAMTSGSS